MTFQIKEPSVKEPKKYATRVSILLYLSTTAPVVIYWIVEGKVDKYTQTPKNETSVCYKKDRVWEFPFLFAFLWSLLGTIFGVFVNRLLLLIDQHHHRELRYSKSTREKIETLLHGISPGPVAAVVFVTFIILGVISKVSNRSVFERISLSFLGGIGIGPLVMQLLQINTESKIYVSRILEDNQAHPAQTLTWSYYLTRLKHDLNTFRDVIKNNGQSRVQLHIKKLLLLIPINFYANDIDELMAYDETINKEEDASNRYTPFSIWKLKFRSGVGRLYAVHHIKELLDNLVRYLKDGPVKVTRLKEIQQVELLYETLFKILAAHELAPDTFRIVPIKLKKADKPQSLAKGELTNCIYNAIKTELRSSDISIYLELN